MQAYNYDPVTKIFLGTTPCQKSPLEEDVYLLPANSTFDAPPELSENEVAVFNNGGWEVVYDYRGKKIYLQNDSRQTDVIKQLNVVLPDGWTMITPPDNESRYVMFDNEWKEYQKTPTELFVEYDAAMENYLEETRCQRGYTKREPSDYISSAVDRWRQDALDWIAFRDSVLVYAQSVENAALAGGVAPSMSEFIDNMPVITWTYE